MRIAFYAPLKPPDHPTPSGDRQIARLLMAALRRGGHEVRLASRMRSYDPVSGGMKAAGRGRSIAARWSGPAPDLWFTYHLYERAPDHLGPAIAARLGIPYVVAEASLTPGRAGPGQLTVIAALGRAAAVIGLNPRDEAGIRPYLADPGCYHVLAPFVAVPEGTAPLAGAPPVMIAIGMMRPGAKLASYRRLGQALFPLLDRPWRLVVVGDGPARGEVEAAVAPLGEHVDWRGVLSPGEVTRALLAADLCVWPAIGEALGLALLEAQAVGVPVVAGDRDGIASYVRNGATGLLVPGDDPADFTRAIAALLGDPPRRQAMGRAARAHVLAAHSLDPAARRLTQILEAAMRCGC